MVSVNVEAKKTVDVMIEKADELNIAVETLDNGATVIDCGVNVDGSFKAGELYTKVCLGGLADVGISIPGDLSEKFALPSVKIKTDSPSISTLGSQKAGWSVSVGDFFALGSGPARAIALKPAETYEEIGYDDYFFGEGVCLVEWAELIKELLPDNCKKIRIVKDTSKGYDYRRIEIED